MKTLVTSVAFLISLSCFSQKKAPIKFGDVPLEQLRQVVYEKDTSAAAFFVADYGQSELKYLQGEGFKLYFERLTRIKIVSKEGLEWANFTIPLYHDGQNEERISGLKAVTYNLENGRIVETKAKGDATFKEKFDANHDLIKVTLPNVKEGSVLEITYKITSDFVFNFQDWQFQQTIPAVWSEYRAVIPEYFHYDKYTQGYLLLTEQEQNETTASIMFTEVTRSSTGLHGINTTSSFNDKSVEYKATNFRWAIKDVPAFKEEPYMTTAKDYVSKINFELSQVTYPDQPPKLFRGTWENLNDELLKNESLGNAGKGSGFLKKLVEERTAGLITPSEKLAAIYSLVREQTEWNGDSRKYVSKDFKEVLEVKKASSAEINLLLMAMLQKAGFAANPVLISTRDNGFVRENMAISSQFNYVIVSAKIGDKRILLDATDHSLPMTLLPQRCLNGRGFMLSEEEPGWVDLAASAPSRTTTNIDLTLQPDGELKGKITFNREGYDAQQMRKQYLSKGESDYCKDLASTHSWQLLKSEFQNVKQLSEPVNEIHELTIAEHAQAGGGLIYLNPLLIHRMEDNPFKTAERHYPVDFGGPFQQTYTGRIAIPEGLVVEEMPKPKVLVLPNKAGKYLYSVTQIGSYLSITSQFSINSGLFLQEDYPTLREFYAQVVAKQAEQIVLKRK